MTADQRRRLREEIDRAKRDELFTTNAAGYTIARHKNYDQIEVPGVDHGTRWAYTHHGCRCEPCRNHASAARAGHKRRNKKEATA